MSQDWPADKVERRSVSALVPYARNARTHSDEQVAQIAASIREFGWTVPALVDEDGGLIAGHCRVLAARKLGLTQIPTMVAKGWSEAQKKAYVIADNKLALNAGWDLEMLAVELGDLQGFDFDLMLTGFSDDELSKLLAETTDGLTDPDAVPDVPADPVAKPGDVWLMGKHRLMCGDGTVKLSPVALRCLIGGLLRMYDHTPRSDLRGLPLSSGNHLLRGVAVFPVPTEPADGRGTVGCARYRGQLPDGSAMGAEVR
jgi:hypothetical protein